MASVTGDVGCGYSAKTGVADRTSRDGDVGGGGSVVVIVADGINGGGDVCSVGGDTVWNGISSYSSIHIADGIDSSTKSSCCTVGCFFGGAFFFECEVVGFDAGGTFSLDAMPGGGFAVSQINGGGSDLHTFTLSWCTIERRLGADCDIEPVETIFSES